MSKTVILAIHQEVQALEKDVRQMRCNLSEKHPMQIGTLWETRDAVNARCVEENPQDFGRWKDEDEEFRQHHEIRRAV